MTLNPATRDLLEAISQALDGTADWPASAASVAIDRVLRGDDDPGAAADWLRDFLAERQRAADGAEPDRSAEFEQARRQALRAEQAADREPITPGDARYYERLFPKEA